MQIIYCVAAKRIKLFCAIRDARMNELLISRLCFRVERQPTEVDRDWENSPEFIFNFIHTVRGAFLGFR